MGKASLLFASMALLFIGCAYDGRTQEPRTPTPQHDWAGAWTVCEKFVKGKLKTPSTAKFPSIWSGHSQYVTYLGDKQYRVESYVDAQNIFGAMLRTNFNCKVEHVEGNTWKLVRMDMR